ncbi:MAG: SUMF1/EgtB/PvdO family nonheme iron enzyme [Nitrospira sp.]|nr:SUMF1/EgtB/PvdO family nonheme iron enzyme [Nitrospira sp.]
MSKILISYRREDSIDVTGRIHDRLVKDFGPGAVFMDVDSIPYGVDFRTYLDEQVSQCEVFLAVIGRDWLRGKERKGRSRLEDPGDFVRIEIESALKRRILVIPVLVGGASVPPAQQLPASIQDLSYRHAIVIRPNPDFHRDMDRLIDHLRTQLAEAKEQLVVPKAQGTVSDVSGTERTGHSDVKSPEEEAAEVKVRPAEPDSAAQAVKSEHEERAALSVASQTTTDGFSSYLLGGIGLIVLVGAVVTFLILQPKSAPVYSPPVVEKKEERETQVIPPQSSPPSSEPVAVTKKQEKPVEKPVSARQSSVPTPQMIRISPGSFLMGGSKYKEEGPIHEVRFAKSFAMARYETTFDEYDRFAQATGRQLPNDQGWGRGRRPVINVFWSDAKAYAQWLSQQTGQRYRLPTEAEWEYAARSGGKDETWAGTSDESQLKDYAVYGSGKTEPVGSKKPNGLGFYDMSGNVWEWVEDCWHDNFGGASTDGSAWLDTHDGNCGQRVLRGGSWLDDPGTLRASLRGRDLTDFRNGLLGFRLVQDIP